MTSLICHFEYYHIWQKIGNAVYFDNIKYLLLKIFRDVILDNISYIHAAFKSYFLLESLYVKLLLDIVEYIFYMMSNFVAPILFNACFANLLFWLGPPSFKNIRFPGFKLF